ncbi:lamin tail domain-containing protein [uncultured Methanomethylovorans sp.]|uniref:lamin tail domain-containing protein n=1 Tax=uncultured Methanomethylovorans sp. TaxID=183759 RepID=UPI002AA91E09|nr:lamin tail domain-containing protein [uncultured Methanomethylovorans sp.]
MNKILKWTLIIFAVLVVIGMAGEPSDQSTKPTDQQESVNTTVQQTSEPVKETSENDMIKEDTTDKQYALPEQTSLAPTQNGNLTVHFIEVGQGDSIFIEYAGKNMLIDAGENNMGSTVSALLKEHGASSLNYVVATHPHADHIGGLLTILNEYPVGQFIDSGYPHTSQTYEDMLTTIDTKNIPFHIAERGENIDLDPGIEIQVLNSGKEQYEDLNENSVVLKIIDKDVSFLLMGDAGLETEASIMAAGYEVDADILKVGHHASTSGSGQSFISAVSPEISIIEVGADNEYGHPHAETLQRLLSVSTVYRTDDHGTITVTTDGSTYTVTTKKTAPSKTSNTSTVTTKDTITTSTPDDAVDTSVETYTSDDGIGISSLSLKEEYVKIKNSGSSSVDLTGWEIKDEDNKNTYTFPSFQLEAGTTVILYTTEGSDTETELYWGSGNPLWNNDGDTAFLYDSEGNLVDSLRG